MGGGSKYHTRYKCKRRSQLQRDSIAAATASVTHSERSGKLLHSIISQLTVVYILSTSPTDVHLTRAETIPPTPPPQSLAPPSHILLRNVTNLKLLHQSEKAQGDRLKTRGDDFRRQLRNASKQTQRAVASRKDVEQKFQQSKAEATAAIKQLNTQLTAQEKTLALSVAKRVVHVEHLKRARKGVIKYKRQNRSLKRRIAQLVGAARTHSLLHKGVYTDSARRLMRQLACLGCSARKIAQIMHLCAQSYGIKLIGKPSARMVGHAITEGVIAAKIQMGEEILEADGAWLIGVLL